MTPLAVGLVAASALLHAGWNLVCKTRKDPGPVFFFFLTLGSVVFWMPLVAWIFASHKFEAPPGIWMILVLSGLCNSIYYLGLGGAYRLSDISMSYPLVKALPILMVTVFCIISGGGKATLAGFAGVFALIAGGVLMPMKRLGSFSVKNYLNKSFALVLTAAVASAGYMLLDSSGVKMLAASAGNLAKYEISTVYIFFENLFILPFLLIFIVCGREERRQMGAFFRKLSIAPFLTGLMCTLSYSLVLMAMSFTENVSLVVALRQLSVPIGAFAGIVLLKESAAIPRILGALLILGGLFSVFLS